MRGWNLYSDARSVVWYYRSEYVCPICDKGDDIRNSFYKELVEVFDQDPKYPRKFC